MQALALQRSELGSSASSRASSRANHPDRASDNVALRAAAPRAVAHLSQRPKGLHVRILCKGGCRIEPDEIVQDLTVRVWSPRLRASVASGKEDVLIPKAGPACGPTPAGAR